MTKRKRWANKERGLEYYGSGEDLYGKEFWVQDGSWASIQGIRIYGQNSDNESSEICLSLTKKGCMQLIKALKQIKWE